MRLVMRKLFSLLQVAHFTVRASSTCTESVVSTPKSLQRSSPGLGAPKKLWWAKEITPEYYVSGRLTPRQFKYAKEGGFQSVVSIFKYRKNDGGLFGGEKLPTTKETEDIVKQCGLNFISVLNNSEQWTSVETINKLGNVLQNIPKPVLVFSDRGYASTVATLLLLVSKNENHSSICPKLDTAGFFDMTRIMGINVRTNSTLQMLSELTNTTDIHAPNVDTQPQEWYHYWPATPVYKNWFIAGQILDSHIQEIKRAGFKSVVNLRAGVSHKNLPSQETVTLLNIKDKGSTYGSDVIGPRQTFDALKMLIIDETKSNTYIGPNSTENFERSNLKEFGDEMGYNESIERQAFKEEQFPYYHMPFVNGEPFSACLFKSYAKDLMVAGGMGPVLVHCASAKRAGHIAVLAAAVQHNKDMTWALSKLGELGMSVSPSKKADVYQMYEGILNNKATDKQSGVCNGHGKSYKSCGNCQIGARRP